MIAGTDTFRVIYVGSAALNIMLSLTGQKRNPQTMAGTLVSILQLETAKFPAKRVLAYGLP